VYTPEQRDALRTELLAASHADPRITGGAITGSASVGLEDRWSDIDLACLRLGLPAAQGRGMMGSRTTSLRRSKMRSSGIWIPMSSRGRSGSRLPVCFVRCSAWMRILPSASETC